MQKQKKNGFTLLELIVVMAIIGILSTMMIGNFVTSQMRARDAKRKNDITQLQRALEQYMNDHGTYPLSTDNDVSGQIIGCGVDPLVPAACTWGQEFSLGLSPKSTYMIKLPVDNRTGVTYHYRSNGTKYQIYTRLENVQDKDFLEYDFVKCGTPYCSFGISSSNTTPDAQTL